MPWFKQFIELRMDDMNPFGETWECRDKHIWYLFQNVSESEARLCQLNEKRKPKGTYGAEWVEGSDRDGYYRAVTPNWKQERIESDGYSSPEVYHDLQRAAVMAKFE